MSSSKAFRLISWNVNGIRAVHRKDAISPLLVDYQPDFLFIQETKARLEQLGEEITHLDGYYSYWNDCKRKAGYSGTALFSKYQPDEVSWGIGQEEFDTEGRTLVARYGNLVLFGVYFPNGKASPERLQFKMDFYKAFQKRIEKELQEGKRVLVCGDVNTAHHPIDLARPKQNIGISGFLPEERAWMDDFESIGMIDTFRVFNPDKTDCYSWWSMRSGARERNVGWRIDYVFVSKNLEKTLQDGFILPHVVGSDHCPVGIDFSLEEQLFNEDREIIKTPLAAESSIQQQEALF